ncbi:MAG: hypothetical protein WCJ92_05840 [Alphaproteobacteria bacterium]
MVFKKIGLFLIVSITVSAGFCADPTDQTDSEQQISSHIKLGFDTQGTVEIPVKIGAIPDEELPVYLTLGRVKTKDQVTELVELIKLSLPVNATISSTDFLKYLKLANTLTADFRTEVKELFSLIPPQNNYDILESAIRTHLAYPGIEFPEGTMLRLPITGFSSAEEAEMYSGFFIKREFEKAKTLVVFAQGYFEERPIPALDFLKFMKIAERFETLEQAGRAISAIEEERRDPDTLVDLFGFDLSCLTLKFPGKENVDIPVATFQIDEVEALNALLKGKTREEVDSAVSLIKRGITQKIIPSSGFLTLMKNAFRSGFAKMTTDNNPDTLAEDLASKLNF